jgi:hypothetical protein
MAGAVKQGRIQKVKPAGLKAARRFSVANGQLSEVSEAGAVLWQLDLARVTHARWFNRKLGQSVTRTLTLSDGRASREIRQHLARRAYLGGPDDMAFRAAVTDTLRALMASQSEFEIEDGPPPAMVKAAYGAGLGSLVLGVVLPVWAVIQSPSLLTIGESAMPGILGVFLGLALVKGYGPKRKVTRRAPAELAAELEQTA